jgi:uncharacterized protein (TIGR03435 family)
MRIKPSLALGSLTALLSFKVHAQTSAKPEFEVADVRVNKLADNPAAEFLPGGQVNLRGVTMKALIGLGWKETRVFPEVSNVSVALLPLLSQFNVNADDYLKGAPPWLNADRFDVIAKAPAGTPTDTIRLMIRTLLTDRFHLVVHTEQKQMKVYVMTIAKGGPKLTAAQPGSESAGTGQPTCARSISPDNVYHRDCRNMTMAELAEQLPSFAPRFFEGKPVLDSTGLKGAWDFRVDWTPMNGGLAPLLQPAQGNEQTYDTGMTIFRTMERNLGLKLEQREQPMQIVVIDRIDRVPTEN